MMLHPPAIDESLAIDTLCRLAADPSQAKALHDVIGDFCHIIRNRLNTLQIGLYLAKSHSPATCPKVWEELASHSREAERRIALFQTVCRPMILRPITIGLDLVLNEFVNRWAPRFLARGVSLESPGLAIHEPSRIDPSRIGEGLDAVASWRLSEAKPGGTIQMHARAMKGWSRIEWSEPLATEEPKRGGLPLAVFAKVAFAHGGGLTRETRDGLRLTIEWPHREPASPA